MLPYTLVLRSAKNLLLKIAKTLVLKRAKTLVLRRSKTLLASRGWLGLSEPLAKTTAFQGIQTPIEAYVCAPLTPETHSLFLSIFPPPPSPTQFQNHLQINVDILAAPEMSRDKRSKVATVPADESFPVPIEMSQQHVFYVVPAEVG